MPLIPNMPAQIYVDLVGEEQQLISLSLGWSDVDLDIHEAEELVYFLNKAIDQAKTSGGPQSVV